MNKLSRAVSALVCAALCASLASCGIKTTVTGDKNVLPRTYNLDADTQYSVDITGVDLGDVIGVDGNKISYTVNIDPSLADSMIITTDENVFSSLEVTLDGDKIKITGEEGRSYLPSEFDITIGCETAALIADGVFDISYMHVSSSPFSLNISGAVSLKAVTERTEAADITISGAASVTAEGSCGYLSASLSGAAELSSYKFEADTADVSALGASSAEVNVLTALNATVDGAGEIRYRGEPTLTSSASGTGSVLPE